MSREKKKPDVVLLTDFGLTTGFVGSLYGVIRNVDQDLAIFDLNHEIKAFDFRQASNLLADTVFYWKEGTVFVSVVDPGVGTDRRSCVARLSNGSYIVTPDNGTLTGVYQNIVEVREIDESVNRLKGSSEAYTFHGRDVYSYTAARLASGIIDFEGVGPQYPVEEIVRFTVPEPVVSKGRVEGVITGCLKHYGEPDTNITMEHFQKAGFHYGDILNVVILWRGVEKYNANVPFVTTFQCVAPGEPLVYRAGTSPVIEIGFNMVKFADRVIPEIYENDTMEFRIIFSLPETGSGNNNK